MGYNVYITRKENWFDEDGPEITVQEWSGYVDTDEEMRMDGFAEVTSPNGEVLRIEQPGTAVWVGYSGHGVDGNIVWFTCTQESICVKNPDDEIIGKMCSVANSLDAKVQGEEGEVYGAEGESDPAAGGYSSKRPWWQFWK